MTIAEAIESVQANTARMNAAVEALGVVDQKILALVAAFEGATSLTDPQAQAITDLSTAEDALNTAIQKADADTTPPA